MTINSNSEVDDEDEDKDSLMVAKRYMTRAGAERFHKELLHLLNVERPRVTAEVSAAAAQGDRSENAEYLYGKKRLREIDRRLRFLQNRLDTSTVVDPSEQRDVGRVYFGATVELEDQDGARAEFQLVGPDETDSQGGKISLNSPVGRALMGKRLSESFVVQRPRGAIEWLIVKITYR